MTTNKKSEALITINIRVPSYVIAKLDAETARLSKSTGLRLRRSAILRAIVEGWAVKP
jgi:hypothetical protein